MRCSHMGHLQDVRQKASAISKQPSSKVTVRP